MDKVYKLFDKFTNMIPGKALHMIRLGAILTWLILATIATVISWQSGAESAPELGQELSLSNIKEDIARKNNLKKAGDVVLPDLNDLIRETRKNENSELKEQTRPNENPLIKPDSNQIEVTNPVRSFNQNKKTGVPVYHGDANNQIIQNNSFKPKKDTGSGGVIEDKTIRNKSSMKTNNKTTLTKTNIQVKSKFKINNQKLEKKDKKLELPLYID